MSKNTTRYPYQPAGVGETRQHPHGGARGPNRRSLLAGALASLAAPGALQAQQGGGGRMLCRFAEQSFTVTLNDSPTARDLLSLLPLELTIEDYSTNEKIAYPPRKLSTEGAGPFDDERPGDFCYYAPWGDIVFFHAGYRYSRGLIRLGRIDGPVDPLLVKGTFPLRLAAAQ